MTPRWMTGETDPYSVGDPTTVRFFEDSKAPRISTDTAIASALKQQYPALSLAIVPEATCDLLGFAAAGHATSNPINDHAAGATPSSLSWEMYVPPATRLGGDPGSIAVKHIFGKFAYGWESHEFVVYLVDGRDGSAAYPQVRNLYVLTPDRRLAEALVAAAGRWSADLHGEVWVFDGGLWTKNAELYRSVRGASWDDVILDEDMKRALIDDHLDFFSSRDTYRRLSVPWKRGLIYYGPPGNGKTISIKATMNTLYSLDPEIPTLYVRTLASWAGPEASIRSIFDKARQFAPCYLVFEDLDTIVSEGVRSYFLNEVDGLKANDGIFMVGSTNHLDQLDPGISKRPSRFDRKYYFPNPDRPQRTTYCRYWQRKLAGNDEGVEFPDRMCPAIARITRGFSFAYMQEAFVAALLAVARRSNGGGPGRRSSLATESGDAGKKKLSVRAAAPTTATGGLGGGWVGVTVVSPCAEEEGEGRDGNWDEELDKFVLWVEIKKQVKILREGMEEKKP